MRLAIPPFGRISYLAEATGLEPIFSDLKADVLTNWTTPPCIYYSIDIFASESSLLLVTRTGVEPVVHAWKACVLIASPTGPLLIRTYKFFQLVNIHAPACSFYHFAVVKKKEGRHWTNRKFRLLCQFPKFFCINF